MKSRACFALLVLLCGSALSGLRSAQLSGPTKVREVTRQGEPRVWVVDSAGGGDFLDLPPAVSAASSGDVIVMRQAGVAYTPFTTNKGLTIVGTGGAPTLRGTTRIRDLPAGEVLVLRGLHLTATIEQPSFEEVLEVTSCAGVVWVEDCSIDTDCNFFWPE